MLLGPLFTGGSALRRVTTRGQLCIKDEHDRAAFSKVFLGTSGPVLLQRVREAESQSLAAPHTPSSVRTLRGLGLRLAKQVPLLKGIENTGLGQQSGSSVASTGDSPDPPLACPRGRLCYPGPGCKLLPLTVKTFFWGLPPPLPLLLCLCG